MPLYEVRCTKCGTHTDIFRSLANYDDLPSCCDEVMERVICAPTVIADIQPYQSMKTGEMIMSRSQHRDHLRAHGLVEVGNDDMTPKKSFSEDKKQATALRSEIAARLDTAKRS